MRWPSGRDTLSLGISRLEVGLVQQQVDDERRSSRSGATRRALARSRRGSTRGTSSSPSGQTSLPAAGGWAPGVVGTNIATSRRDSSAAASARVTCVPDPRGSSTVRSVAGVAAEALDAADHQPVQREPDRPAPVGVAAEQPGRRLARLVVDRVGVNAAAEVGDVRHASAASTATGCRTGKGTPPRRAPPRRTRTSRSGESTENRCCCARADGVHPGDLCCHVGLVVEEPVQPRGELRQPPQQRVVDDADRGDRHQPDHRAHPHRQRLRRRCGAARRSRSRRSRPTALSPASPSPLMPFMAVAIRVKCSKNFVATSSYVGSCAARVSAISSRSRQYIAIHAVPSVCSRCPATGGCLDRSNGPMLSRPRKPPSKTLLPSASSRLTHQVKLISSLWKIRSRKSKSRDAVDLEHPQRRPRVHRRVDVGEVPLVRGQLAARVHVPLAAQQDQLALGERRVDVGERDGVEREVPRGVPGVLPRVGHRDHVAVVEVAPAAVADRARGRAAA